MKTIKLYTPVILQAIFLLIGFILVNSLSARDAEPASAFYTNINAVDNENELEVEDWMLSPTEWNSTEENLYNNNLSCLVTSVDLEDEIQLEPWMLNPNDVFWTQNIELAFSNEDEILLENWMTDAKLWLN